MSNLIKPESRFYIYKLTTDNGGAPCVYRNELSLAICKPKVRTSASVGDWIFGFGSRDMGERLIYVAEVTSKEISGDYYKKEDYFSRPDCIYRWENGQAALVGGKKFHQDGMNLTHDLGEPPRYPAASVLLSNNFRYFGGKHFNYSSYLSIVTLVKTLKQGHRVNLSVELKLELHNLVETVWKEFPSTKKLGEPTHSDQTRRCNEDTDETEGVWLK